MRSEQQTAGRFTWAPNNRLRNVPDWLDAEHVVPSDTKVSLLVALGLLMVCLVNTAGLLLAKFLRRSGEIGVRRALGAQRGAIYAQFLTEAGIIGAAGGVLGLLLTGVGVASVSWVLPRDIASLAQAGLSAAGADPAGVRRRHGAGRPLPHLPCLARAARLAAEVELRITA